MTDQAGKEAGIFADILPELRKTLAGCAAFVSHEALSAIFVDPRLQPWQPRLPQVQSIEQRVNQVIDLLHQAENEQGENALVLLLHVLKEHEPTRRAALTRLRHALQRGLGDEAAPSPLAGATPYLGLSTFQPEDAPFFFGRDDLIAQLVEKVEGENFLAVLGPSGSGKSSVVLAGLLPALKAGALPGSEQWQHVVLKPGSLPLDTLAAALTRLQGGDLSAVLALRAQLAADEQALLTVAKFLQPTPTSRLVLVVDQLEELWTQLPSEPEPRQEFLTRQQAPFLRLLLTAASAPVSPLLIILTLRADFLHRAAEHPKLAHWIAEHDVIVSPMQPDELRETIEEPAALVGGRFEPGLVEKLMEGVAGEPGALPLLEYTLLELWRAASETGGLMTWEAFRALGGVEGALATRADAILDQYTDEERDELRQMLLRLVQPGEGAEDTSRRARLMDLMTSDRALEEVQRLLQPLVDERLLTSGYDRVSGQESIEVSHEALIRAWPTLRNWIDEARADLRLHLQLGEAAREWEAEGRDREFLWQGLRLANTEAWLGRTGVSLNVREACFLEASCKQAEALQRATEARLEAEREAQLEHEQLLTERAEAEEKLRHEAEVRATAEAEARREAESRRVAAQRNVRVISLLLLLSLSLAGLAWNRQMAAAARADEALALYREAQARSAINELSQGSDEQPLLLALSAVYGAEQPSDDTFQALGAAVENTQIRFRLTGHAGWIDTLAWSPDGHYLASGGSDGMARIWEGKGGQLLHTLDAHAEMISTLAWSLDGEYLATGSGGFNLDTTVRIWEGRTGRLLHTLQGHTQMITALAWSPDGRYLAAGGEDKTGRIWEVSSGHLLYTLEGHTDTVTTLAWSPDGRYLATGGGVTSADGDMDTTVRVWDGNTGRLLYILEDHTDSIYTLAWSPDGRSLATGGADGAARIWEGSSGELLRTLEGATSSIVILAWSPDGRYLATGSLDGKVRIWEGGSGQLLHTLEGHTNSITTLAWSPDGQYLATGSGSFIFVGHDPDTRAYIWEASSGQLLHSLDGHTASIYTLAWSPDGHHLATGGGDGTIRIWEARKQIPHTLRGHVGSIRDLAWSPDGRYLATGGWDTTARVWERSSGQPLRILKGHTAPINVLAWSPDGRYLATGGGTSFADGDTDSAIRIWEGRSGQLRHKLEGHTDSIDVLAWSPDGRYLATGGADTTARIWEGQNGQLLHTLEGHSFSIDALVWSPDGRYLAIGDTPARIWDGSSGQLLHTLEGHTESVTTLAWSPDGRYLATGSRAPLGSQDTAGTMARIWDGSSGQLLHVLEGHTDVITTLAWSPDGHYLATGSYDRSARIWDGSTGQLLHTLQGHTDGIAILAWSPDGRYLATGGGTIYSGQDVDLVVRIWDRSSGRLLQTLEGHTGLIDALAWSPDGRYLATGGSDSTVRIWPANPHLLFGLLIERVCRIRTDAEIQAHIPAWQGCDAELAAVADELARYYELGGR